MSNIVASTPRNLQAYSTEAFPEGLYIDQSTGEVFASNRSLARIIDKSASIVSDYVNSGFEGDRNSDFETAKVHTRGGLQGVRLSPESVILSAITKYKPDLLAACASAGLRVYLHRVAGFEVQSTAVAPPPMTMEQMKVATLEAQLDSERLKRELAETREKLNVQLAETNLILVERENYILKATKQRPGLENMLEMAQELNPAQGLLPTKDLEETFTAHEWMLHTKQLILTDTMFRKFISKVHGAYKAVYHKGPDFGYRLQDNETGNRKKVQVYTHAHFGILEQCYIQTLMECSKKP
jgi:hypothetical protein